MPGPKPWSFWALFFEKRGVAFLSSFLGRQKNRRSVFGKFNCFKRKFIVDGSIPDGRTHRCAPTWEVWSCRGRPLRRPVSRPAPWYRRAGGDAGPYNISQTFVRIVGRGLPLPEGGVLLTFSPESHVKLRTGQGARSLSLRLGLVSGPKGHGPALGLAPVQASSLTCSPLFEAFLQLHAGQGGLQQKSALGQIPGVEGPAVGLDDALADGQAQAGDLSASVRGV